MTATAALTEDLKKQVIALENDLRQRVDEVPQFQEEWRDTHRKATEKERTAWSWTQWRDDRVTQTAVAWVLMSVFIRFCEDNALVKPVWITGPGRRRQEALDAENEFYRQHPTWTSREWLEDGIQYLGSLPATRALVDAHSAFRYASPSGGAVEELVKFWRDRGDDGNLIHDLSDDTLSTRFLGDLYQDLSQHAKDTYALLQTPVFVQEHILDRTLEPALRERPLEGFRMIDPTCGSGHFLLGAFARLLDRWHKHAPALEIQARVQSALDAIHGVDLNPFAVAIARFRLTVAALQACELHSLEDAPAFKYHLAVGDSLIHGPDPNALPGAHVGAYLPFHYSTEDSQVLLELLEEGRYDTVVGNPPYITVKDKALNKIYRSKFGKVCKGTYALSVPFMVQFFALAKRGEQSGWVGQITSNSFMDQDFGVPLVEEFLPRRNLILVEDTSGATIPGHGTPTIIVVGRNQPPRGSSVRAVLSIRGEPGRPKDPARGVVWNSIDQHSNDVGWNDEWITVVNLDRRLLSVHPWSLRGGDAMPLQKFLERDGSLLRHKVSSIGYTGQTNSDEVFLTTAASARRHDLAKNDYRAFLTGTEVRNFQAVPKSVAVFPYDSGELRPLTPGTPLHRWFWPFRAQLGARATFGGSTYKTEGRPWWAWHQVARSKLSGPAITWPVMQTHNHFVYLRECFLHNRHAPIIQLRPGAQEDDFVKLFGLLNSSTTCFWLKQVSHNKGEGGGARVDAGYAARGEPFRDTYEFTGNTLLDYPLPGEFPLERARILDSLAQELNAREPYSVCTGEVPSRELLTIAKQESEDIRARMIAVQEELDWEVYRLYGILDDDLTYGSNDLPGLTLGQRAFEIALARSSEETTWFRRTGSAPIIEVPARWPAAYRELVERRLKLMEEHPYIRLLEKPGYKRQWSEEPWADRQEQALRSWLLDRLEDHRFWFDSDSSAEPKSVGQLADEVTRDKDIVSVLTLWEGRPDVPVSQSLEKLLVDEAVPFLAAYRYKDSGLRKREAWEETWDLQRKEDLGERVDEIPVPPVYKQVDFRKASYWHARKKLDVPKERFILYPGANREGDPTPLLGWAGWDHAEQSLALSRIIGEREAEGWDDERLVPLVAGLCELQPWVQQWHSEVDERFGVSLAAFCQEQLDQRSAQVGKTCDELAGWRPAPSGRGRKPRG